MRVIAIVLAGAQHAAPLPAHPVLWHHASDPLNKKSPQCNALASSRQGTGYAFVFWDFDGAERESHRALVINPGYATGLQWYAELLENLGRYDEALALIRRAQEADPFSLIINAVHGQILSRSGRP